MTLISSLLVSYVKPTQDKDDKTLFFTILKQLKVILIHI